MYVCKYLGMQLLSSYSTCAGWMKVWCQREKTHDYKSSFDVNVMGDGSMTEDFLTYLHNAKF